MTAAMNSSGVKISKFFYARGTVFYFLIMAMRNKGSKKWKLIRRPRLSVRGADGCLQTDAPQVVDAAAVLTGMLTAKCLETIGRGDPQVLQRDRAIEGIKQQSEPAMMD